MTDIKCAASLDISMVKEFGIVLNNALDSAEDITIFAGEVERADTAALQLLYAFMQEAKLKGLTVNWEQPSETLRRSAELLDLAKDLNI